MKNWKYLLYALVAMALSGCSSTRITSSWKATETSPYSYKKVLVLGLIRDSDRSIQDNMENHLVMELKNLGYDAVSSLQEYGPRAFDKLDETTAVQSIRNNGFDAVLTIVMLDKTKEKRYVAGNTFYSPYSYYYNRFWGYRVTLVHRIYEPGYYVTDTKYFWESNLFDMHTQKMVFSVQTQSFDPANSEMLGHEYGQLIVKHMVKEDVLRNLGNSPARAF